MKWTFYKFLNIEYAYGAFLTTNLDEMNSMSRDEIFSHRKKKFLSIGRNKGFTSTSGISENLLMKESFFDKLINKFLKDKKVIIFSVLVLLVVLMLFQL